MLHASEPKETTGELLATAVCQLDEEDCMFGKCDVCPGTEYIVTLLKKSPALDTNQVDHVQVQQWMSGGRCKLETTLLTPREFCSKDFGHV